MKGSTTPLSLRERIFGPAALLPPRALPAASVASQTREASTNTTTLVLLINTIIPPTDRARATPAWMASPEDNEVAAQTLRRDDPVYPDGGRMPLGQAGPLSSESERVLMQQLVAGDEAAIRAIYARFGRSVYAMGLRILGNVEAAEELTQDVFLAAWRKGGAFDPSRGRLSTWLMAIAHNMAVDRLRHDRGVGRPTLVPMEELPERASPAGEEDVLIERDTARRAMAGLSEAERQR